MLEKAIVLIFFFGKNIYIYTEEIRAHAHSQTDIYTHIYLWVQWTDHKTVLLTMKSGK